MTCYALFKRRTCSCEAVWVETPLSVCELYILYAHSLFQTIHPHFFFMEETKVSHHVELQQNESSSTHQYLRQTHWTGLVKKLQLCSEHWRAGEWVKEKWMTGSPCWTGQFHCQCTQGYGNVPLHISLLYIHEAPNTFAFSTKQTKCITHFYYTLFWHFSLFCFVSMNVPSVPDSSSSWIHTCGFMCQWN